MGDYSNGLLLQWASDPMDYLKYSNGLPEWSNGLPLQCTSGPMDYHSSALVVQWTTPGGEGRVA